MGANKSELIRALFAAYRANDRASVEKSFAADFTFTSPYDDRIDKATYFERCWRVSDWISARPRRMARSQNSLCPHPEERPLGRVSKDGRRSWPILRDAAQARGSSG